MNGAKWITEAMDLCMNNIQVVEERSSGASLTVRIDVAWRSEYVGISNEKIGEIPIRWKPKDSVRSVYPLRVSRPLSRGQLE